MTIHPGGRPVPVQTAGIAAADAQSSRLWKALGAAATLDEAAEAWTELFLAREAESLPGPIRQLEIWSRGRNGDRLVLRHGDGLGESDDLRRLAVLALGEKRGVGQAGGEGAASIIAQPFGPIGAPTGAVVLGLGLAGPRETGLRVALRRLQWSLGPLTAVAADEAVRLAEATPALAVTCQRLLTAFASRPRMDAAARALTTELAEALGADRASLGMNRRRGMRVIAVSHSGGGPKRHALERGLSRVMDEASDQRAILVWPATPDDPNVTLAHEDHARQEGVQAILTVPLHVEDRLRGPITCGALVIERSKGPAFTEADLALADGLADLLAPSVWEKWQTNRSLPTRAVQSVWRALQSLFGPDYLALKLVLLVIAGILGAAAVTPAAYEVTADVQLEGEVQRAVAVPFDGFLATAPARPGDRVRKGDVLASLDDRDLVLERLKVSAEARETALQYEKALADKDLANLRIIRAQIAAAEAKIRTIDERLARVVLRAPFDGLVISGDHSQQLASAVNRGDLLYEVVPSDAYRVSLAVPEDQLGDLKTGQTGSLRLLALPDETFSFTLDRITPIAHAGEGKTVFRVEARLQPGTPTERLRPGLQGVGHVSIDTRTLLYTWTRSFVTWVRQSVWRWVG